MWRFQFTEITQLSSLSAGFYGLSHRNPIHTFELRSLGLFVSAMCPLFPRRHAKPTSFRAFCTQSDSVSLIGLAANKSCIIVALDCLASWPASRMAFKRAWSKAQVVYRDFPASLSASRSALKCVYRFSICKFLCPVISAISSKSRSVFSNSLDVASCLRS